jgi:hypothetical protein
MKFRRFLAVAIALAAAASLPLLAVAKGPGGSGAPGQVAGMPWGSYVNAADCSGKLVVNVSFGVTKDADSGYAGYWAYDDYQKHLQIFDEGSGNFCAVAQYVGTFTTIGGQPDPAGTSGNLPNGIKGTMQGGYYATFQGTLVSNPDLATRGRIGPFDFGGTPSGSTTPFDWTGAYFSSVTHFLQPSWGWVYRTPHCGTWYNDSELQSGQGDIYCPAS